jgi:hypothetical protein
MQRCSPKARFEFIHLMMKHCTTVPEFQARNAALKLLRYGTTLGRIAEDQCNGFQDWRGNWDERAEKRAEAKEVRITVLAEKLCESIGCKMVTQGDPRGNVLKIVVPDGYTNDWGREGIGVPTS